MSRGYRIRFHLAKGEHFMHWQVKNLDTKEVNYYDPAEYSLSLSNCTLKNQRATAEKIHAGENKSVCAWINADHVTVQVEACRLATIKGQDRFMYNPRRATYWMDHEGRNMDNMSFTDLVTVGRTVGIPSVSPDLALSCQEVPLRI